MLIRKAVIPAAGLGTRLLPLTKEMPKEMLPLFDKRGGFSFKPLIQIVFERLYETGIREFCIITGRGKRAIEDHFSRDDGYLAFLESVGKRELAEKLKSLYEAIETTRLLWVNQPKPTGLGAAVLLAEPFIGGEPFIVHAGDTYIASDNYVKRMLEFFEKVKPGVLFLAAEVPDPKGYGILEEYEVEDEELYRVYKVVEKPRVPKTNIAIVPVYVFASKIFETLEKVGPGVGGEIQLTDAIGIMARDNPVYAMVLKDGEDYMDIGNPENYLRALKRSFQTYSHK
jgi:UTP--glucose-1-phosphate uridylyltransferase